MMFHHQHMLSVLGNYRSLSILYSAAISILFVGRPQGTLFKHNLCALIQIAAPAPSFPPKPHPTQWMPAPQCKLGGFVMPLDHMISYLRYQYSNLDQTALSTQYFLNILDLLKFFFSKMCLPHAADASSVVPGDSVAHRRPEADHAREQLAAAKTGPCRLPNLLAVQTMK